MQGNQCFDAAEIVLVGVKDLKDYYVDLVAKTLPDWLGKDKKYSTFTLDSHITGGRDLTTLDVARWMDTEKGFNDAVSQLKSQAGSGKVFIVPAILGTKGNEVYTKLVAALGCPVVETTGMIWMIFSKNVGGAAGLAPGFGPYLVAMLIWALGLSLGGPTGYAMSAARDLGPRLAHAGICSILVLSGESTRQDVETSDVKPHIIAENVAQILEALKILDHKE